MKKQILFLAMFTLALIFAGSNHVFGQVVYSDYVTGVPVKVPAAALGCAGSVTSPQLNPTPGVTYTYTISTTPAVVGSVLWFVTDQNAVLTGGALVAAASRDKADGTGSYISTAPAAVYNTTGLTTKTIDISWKNFDGATNEVLLVAYVTGAAGCSDNVQVWRIQPVFNFTLDVLSMFDVGGLGTILTPASECVSMIESANYTPATPALTMNYGKNYVFFSVNAANFVGSWMPDLQATATYGTPSVTWATPADAQLNAAGIATGTWNLTTVEVPAAGGAGVAVGAAGEGIVVRVEVLNGNNEGITNNTVTLTVDGVMYDPIALPAAAYTNATLKDMDDAAGVCVNTVTDEADFTILARPTITESSPTTILGPFEPKN